MAHTLHQLKPAFQAWLRPAVGRIESAGITANQVTLAAMLLSLAVGAAISAGAVVGNSTWPYLMLPIWLPLRMALNAIDGMLAREFGQKSPMGAYLNELCDVVSDAALMLPFAFIPPFGPWSVGLVIFASALSEMAGALAPMVGAERRYDGPMGKSDRAFVAGGLGLYVGLSGPLTDAAFWLMPLIAVCIGWNILNRTRRGAAAAGKSSA